MSQPLNGFLFLFCLSLFFKISHGDSTLSTTCPTRTCSASGVPIKYPFWLVDDSSDHYCGYTRFVLTCSDDEPVIAISEDKFYVKTINYDNHTITLVHIDVLHQACPRVQHNLTLDDIPLNYSYDSDLKLSFHFICTSSCFISSSLSPNSIDCLKHGTNQSYVIVVGSQTDVPPYWYGTCEENVVVAVRRSKIVSYSDLATEYGGALSQVFVLDWLTLTERGACEGSGGLCAFKKTHISSCTSARTVRLLAAGVVNVHVSCV